MCNIISQHKVSVKQSWQQTFKVLQEQIPIDGLDGYAKSFRLVMIKYLNPVE